MAQTIRCKLAEDHWFVYNTLSLILPYLETPDLLRCLQVCKLWHHIIQDPIFWKTTKFTNCKIDCGRLMQRLRKHKTLHLKIHNCQFYNLKKEQNQNQNLRTLEINECSSELFEIFLNETENLNNIKIKMISGSFRSQINLNFIYKISNLGELRINCERKIQDLGNIFTNLKNLRTLYLLNFENIIFNENFTNIKNNKLEILALGHVHDMPEEKIDSILRASPALKKLRLESCVNWNPIEFFKTIGQMENITCLELLDFKIVTYFDRSFKYCQKIKELTIIPSCDRFRMGIFNIRIIRALENVTKTLKKITLGFSERYLAHVKKISEQNNVIPLYNKEDNNGSDPLFEYCYLLSLHELQARLSSLMTGVHVKVKKVDYLGDIFI